MLAVFFRKAQKSGKGRKKYPFPSSADYLMHFLTAETLQCIQLCVLLFFLSILLEQSPNNDRIPLPASKPNLTIALLLDTKVFLDFYPEK